MMLEICAESCKERGNLATSSEVGMEKTDRRMKRQQDTRALLFGITMSIGLGDIVQDGRREYLDDPPGDALDGRRRVREATLRRGCVRYDAGPAAMMRNVGPA